MLKIISSKNIGEVYVLSRKMREKEKNSSSFLDCSIDEAEVLSENISIFGDKSCYLISIDTEGDLNKINEKLLEKLDVSEHLFVVYGSGAGFEKSFGNRKIEKIIEKKNFDFPKDMVKAIQKGDKKNGWYFLTKELSQKEAEPTHGSCVFGYKSLLVYLNDPKKNSPNSGVKDFSWSEAKMNAVAGKRVREEVVDKYFNLVLAYHKARMGELDLAKQLETWVLEN